MSKDPGYSDSKTDVQGSRMRTLQTENEKLKEALKFYASIQNNNRHMFEVYINNKQVSRVTYDGGEIARKALDG